MQGMAGLRSVVYCWLGWLSGRDLSQFLVTTQPTDGGGGGATIRRLIEGNTKNMMARNPLELYKEHFVEKDFERLDLFQLLREKYGGEAAIYPGSFVHVTPSFVFPVTTYIETDKRAKRFFENPGLNEFINSRKIYTDDFSIQFYSQDYREIIEGEDENYDLLISQYAGFVSKYCKRYLKIGGVLLANNSHGDAGMAAIDDDFKFIGAILKSRARHQVSEKNLSEYFVPKKAVKITAAYLESIQKGIGYTKTASAYLFRRVK